MRLIAFIFTVLISLPSFCYANDTAQLPIKIGDISAYTGLAYYAEPYRQGWQLALEEINAAGGVLGRKVEVISRDSRGNPAEAVNTAQDLIHTEEVFALMGPILSHVGLAVSEISKREKVPLITALVGTDKLLWEEYHPYVFRIYSGVYQLTSMMMESAQNIDATKWAVVSENYEAGHAHADDFMTQLKAINPNIEFVEKQYPALNKINAGSVVQAVKNAEPEALFVFLLGNNMTAFIREMRLRGLDDIPVVNPTLGLVEEQRRYGETLPVGWHVLSMPDYETAGRQYQAFYKAFENKYGESPTVLSTAGYLALKSIASAIEKSGQLDVALFVKNMEGDHFDFFYDQPFSFRSIDHQSNFAWSKSKTVVANGKAGVSDVENLDPKDHFAPVDYVMKRRSGGAK